MEFISKLWNNFTVVPVLVTLLTSISCLKEKNFSLEPEIKFISYTFKDTALMGFPDTNIYHLGKLTFSFTDGDGDIGLMESDTAPPLDYDLYVTRLGIKNGVTEKDVFLSFRIPFILPKGQNKSLRGEIDVDLTISPVWGVFPFDTVNYEVYIRDRALHQSNIITTPLIVL